MLARLGQACAALKLGGRCAIVSDRHVMPLYGAAAEEALRGSGFDCERITVPAGETAKSLKTIQAGYGRLAGARLERKSFIVALGGGVVGDMAGFLAATYLRGLPFVQVPTTLLAQVDSSVGGKVGVNLKAGKNLVGAFYQPRLVLCDLDALRTLPEREFRAGLAEVIKYGIIYDARLFRRLERELPRLLERDPRVLAAVIARCCEIKAEVVAMDEREIGPRAILNFGHTLGHAVEKVGGYGRWLHGEAVAIGMAYAVRLSTEVKGFPVASADAVIDLLEKLGLPVRPAPGDKMEWPALREAMMLDKKTLKKRPRFVLAQKLGAVVTGCEVDEAILAETWYVSGK